MDSILNIIQCCRKEEIINNKEKGEVNVPVDNNQKTKNYQNLSYSPKFKYLESSNIKSSEINNTMILNENNNYQNNTIEDNSNNNSSIKKTNLFNNENKDTMNNSTNQIEHENQIIYKKIDTFSIKNQQEIISPIKEANKTNIMSNNHANITKIINKASNNNINKRLEIKKHESSRNISKTYNKSEIHKNESSTNNLENKKNKSSKNLSKIYSKNGNDSISNKGTILTLNDLVLINQNQDEKFYETGSKLLLSGELFFWKEIILQTNGIKNSLRKEKDDHVFFGLKNKSNYAGVMYNDFIINFFWHQEDVDIIETITGRVFEIYYNKKTKDYTLKFLHPNLILYYKINNFVYFNTGKEYYLLLGNVFMTINVKKTSPIEKSIIIQVEIENNKPIKYTFNQNQTPIKIGRTNHSEIPIFSSCISKRHGIIEYSKNIQSFYYKDMGSTNSSTLLIKDGDNLKIKGEMNFKLEDVYFKIQEIP